MPIWLANSDTSFCPHLSSASHCFLSLQIWKEQNDKKFTPPPLKLQSKLVKFYNVLLLYVSNTPLPFLYPRNRAGPIMFYHISTLLHETGTGPTWVPGKTWPWAIFNLLSSSTYPLLQRYNTENSKQSQFQHSCFCERFIYSLIGLPILLLENRWAELGNIVYRSLTDT